MIWSHDEVSDEDVLSRELTAKVSASLQESGSNEHASEVAHAVAAYWRQLAEDSIVPNDYLLLLLSRALTRIGEKDAAEALMEKAGAVADGMAEILLRFKSVSPGLWNVFASRLVRPTRWSGEPGRIIWVLDLGRLKVDPTQCIELSFHQAVKSLLREMAEVWDADSGNGGLGLKGLSCIPRTATGSVREREQRELIAEFCSQVLERLSSERGWSAVPRVLDMDIHIERTRKRH